MDMGLHRVKPTGGNILTYSLITLTIIDQILDVHLHRWTPVRVWDMAWHQCTRSSHPRPWNPMNWLRVFRSAEASRLVIREASSCIREQYGQKNAGHSVTDVGREWA